MEGTGAAAGERVRFGVLPGVDRMDARKLVSEISRKNIVISSKDTLLADIDGWDSLKGVRLVLRLQEIVGRDLSENDIAGLQSIADVEKVLQSTG
jgi:acyl carrier protein